ncbi:hypothetical protein V2J09_002689 [Rumex salicifolius]
MSGFEGVVVSDQYLQSQFTQVELRSLKSKYITAKKKSGVLKAADLAPVLAKLKGISGLSTENDIRAALVDSYPDMSREIDFETFLRDYLTFQGRASGQGGNKRVTSVLRQSTTTLVHVISETEKASYVAHINNCLGEDPFLKQFLPINPSTNQFKLINVAVPGTIDERTINTKKNLNPWERNENHTLCLNSLKAIGCTVVNIGEQDLIEGRPYLIMGLLSQIYKIQLLSDLSLKKTPQLLELAEKDQDLEELMALPPDKVLLRWMNFQLKKAGYKKEITNFSTDLKDGEAYAHLLNVLAPEHSTNSILEVSDPTKRAKMIVEQADILDCSKYISPKDIVDGSTNLNLTFVAQIFQHRNGLKKVSKEKLSVAEHMIEEDVNTSREERCFRLWINSLGVDTYVNNVFEDVRNGWVLLEVLDKVSAGSVRWKQATKPPIKLPFRKLENCNQVVNIGKRLNLSLVNVAGYDILMRFNMLQLLKNLRSHSGGKEMTDAAILSWANQKVKISGKTSKMESFKDKSLSNGVFFLELLTAVEPRVIDWKLVTKGETDEDKKMNASYIISVARKLGCSIFLLPEDIIEVNQKMMLTLTASIMYWALQNRPGQMLPFSEDGKPADVSSSASGEVDDNVATETSSLSTDESVNDEAPESADADGPTEGAELASAQAADLSSSEANESTEADQATEAGDKQQPSS